MVSLDISNLYLREHVDITKEVFTNRKGIFPPLFFTRYGMSFVPVVEVTGTRYKEIRAICYSESYFILLQ